MFLLVFFSIHVLVHVGACVLMFAFVFIFVLWDGFRTYVIVFICVFCFAFVDVCACGG